MSPREPLDHDACYRAVRGKDPRFDGVFYSGVATTGIYCRPSCPAITPKKENLTFFRTAAAAQAAGFRACKRCRPDAAPGSPEWKVRADLVGRAMRLIADGVIDRDGVSGLAAAVGYSERQVNRLLVAELGVGPAALARSQRARTARILLETSNIPISDVAFAAGFTSIRQFNDTIRDIFATTPTQLRARAVGAPTESPNDKPAGSIVVRLSYRQPMNVRGVLDFLGHRAVIGIEEYCDGTFTKSLPLPHGNGVVALSMPTTGRAETRERGWIRCELWLDDVRDLTAAVQRCRRLLDLDADPTAIDGSLAEDPVLRSLVQANPGHRMPGSLDANEVAFRIVIGQQVSTKGARTVAGRLVAQYGQPLQTSIGGVTHSFPTPEAIAEADPDQLAMPSSRKRAIKALASALAEKSIVLSPGSDWDEASEQLLALHGIGPWTVAAVRMRGLGDPDVFLSTDLGIQQAMSALGADANPTSIASNARAWRPWRSYATHLLWASLDDLRGKSAAAVRTSAGTSAIKKRKSNDLT